MVTVGLIFGILMIFWGISIIGGMAGWPGPWISAGQVLQWILFACLGYKVFGPLIQ
jgi:hypothetical protein